MIATRVRNGLIDGTVMFALLSAVVYRAKGRQAWREIAPWLLALALVWFIVTPLSIPLVRARAAVQGGRLPVPHRHCRGLCGGDALFVVALQDGMATQGSRVASTARARRRCRCSASWCSRAGALPIACTPTRPCSRPFKNTRSSSEHAAKLAAGWDSLEFFMPVWTTLSFEDFRSAVTKIPRVEVVAQNAGDVRIQRWAPRNIRLQVDLREPRPITVRQFYFPGWRARNARNRRRLPRVAKQTSPDS